METTLTLPDDDAEALRLCAELDRVLDHELPRYGEAIKRLGQ